MLKLKKGGVVRVVETEHEAELYKEIGYEVIDENYTPKEPTDTDKEKTGKDTKPPKEA